MFTGFFFTEFPSIVVVVVVVAVVAVVVVRRVGIAGLARNGSRPATFFLLLLFWLFQISFAFYFLFGFYSQVLVLCCAMVIAPHVSIYAAATFPNILIINRP